MYLCDDFQSLHSGSTWPTPRVSWTKISARCATRPAMSSTPHWMPPPVPRTVTGRRKMNLPRIAKKRVGCFGFYIFKGGLFKGSMDPHFSGISLWQCVAKLFGKICHKIFQIKGGQFWSKSFPSVYFWCIFRIFWRENFSETVDACFPYSRLILKHRPNDRPLEKEDSKQKPNGLKQYKRQVLET